MPKLFDQLLVHLRRYLSVVAEVHGETTFAGCLVGGTVVTPHRAAEFSFTDGYFNNTLAFLVADHRREEFSRYESILKMKSFRAAMPENRYFDKPLKEFFPNIELIKVDSARTFLKGKIEKADALVVSAEVGAAWTLLYPEYSVVVPKGIKFSAPSAFGLPLEEVALGSFMNTWLDLKQKTGVMDKLYNHWILGGGQSKSGPRWSVIRDVLHWTD